MTKTFNSDAFEAWLRKTGRKWYHLNAAEQRAAIKEYTEQAK